MNLIISAMFNFLSAFALNMDEPKILLFGKDSTHEYIRKQFA